MVSCATEENKPDVLLLERHHELRQLLKLHLESLGFRPLSASSSEEALKLWVENKKTLSLFISDWTEKRGLTPRDLVSLFKMGKPSVRAINFAPFVNLAYSLREFAGQRGTVIVPRSLKAFRAVLFGQTDSSGSDADCSDEQSRQIAMN